MSLALSDFLQLVAPALPSTLVPPDVRRPIEMLAASLAPVPCCGWEVRLGESQELDFHQGILADDGAPRQLLEHLRRGGGHETPAGLEQLAAAWCGDGPALGDEIRELWLEFDRPPLSSLSVFVGFAQARRARWDTLRTIIDVLIGPEAGAPWHVAVKRCISACPDGGLVTHIGLMLGRPSPCLRLNVAGVGADEGVAYLAAVGWPGDLDEARELIADLSSLADGLTMCLDVADTVRPRLGLECHLNVQPPDEPRWKPLLDRLVDRDWCTPAKRTALLDWPGVDTPMAAQNGWPAALVRDSLVRPADHFTSVQRRINHVKVDWRPDESSVQAKAYLLARHRWLRPAEEESNAPAPPRPHRADAPDAAAAATEFLLGARDRAGWWRDFSATEGSTGRVESSDEWVTAFVGTALVARPDPRARHAARRGWKLLVARRSPRDGWGFGRVSPVDADGTAWGLRLAAAVGAGNTPRAQRGREVLQAHALPDGGLVTYRPEVCPHPTGVGMLPPDGSYSGWHTAAHACIAAPAALAGLATACDFLRAAQREDGGWRAYWWDDDEYPTALAVQALAETGRQDDRARVDRAVHWALRRLGADGSVRESPFATAWVAQIMRQGSGARARAARGRAVAWLVEHQDPDGGWRASGRMLVPRPDLLERPDPYAGRVAIDRERNFTTASVLFALSENGA
jgi:Prenyltransferase and squalene oxidase repeat